MNMSLTSELHLITIGLFDTLRYLRWYIRSAVTLRDHVQLDFLFSLGNLRCAIFVDVHDGIWFDLWILDLVKYHVFNYMLGIFVVLDQWNLACTLFMSFTENYFLFKYWFILEVNIIIVILALLVLRKFHQLLLNLLPYNQIIRPYKLFVGTNWITRLHVWSLVNYYFSGTLHS